MILVIAIALWAVEIYIRNHTRELMSEKDLEKIFQDKVDNEVKIEPKDWMPDAYSVVGDVCCNDCNGDNTVIDALEPLGLSGRIVSFIVALTVALSFIPVAKAFRYIDSLLVVKFSLLKK